MCNVYELKYDLFGWAKAHDELLHRNLALPGGVAFDQANIDLTWSTTLYPDYRAPIVRRGADGVDEVHFARWGMPSPQFVLKQAVDKKVAALTKKGQPHDYAELLRMQRDEGVTNLRNLESPHWRRWQAIENRCVVPITAFSEPDQVGGTYKPIWFSQSDERPLAYFAGVWTPWACVRKVKSGWEECDLYGFLTTEANVVVAPFHSKAMPVFLQSPEEVEIWLTAPWSEAVNLQRPLAADALRVVEPPPPRKVTDEESAPSLVAKA